MVASQAQKICKEGTSICATRTFQSGKEVSQRQTCWTGCSQGSCSDLSLLVTQSHLLCSSFLSEVVCWWMYTSEPRDSPFLSVLPCALIAGSRIPVSSAPATESVCLPAKMRAPFQAVPTSPRKPQPTPDRLFFPLSTPSGFQTCTECVSGTLACEKPPNSHPLHCGHVVAFSAVMSGGSYLELHSALSDFCFNLDIIYILYGSAI